MLLILNEAPYGSEKTYNAVRLAMAVQQSEPATDIRLFLMADAVAAAIPGQSTPQGFYNIERMLRAIITKGGKVRLCGSCCEARGLKGLALIEGAELSTMSELAQWVLESEKTLVF